MGLLGKALLAVAALALCSCAVGTGVNTDLIGPQINERQIYAEVSATGTMWEKGRLSLENEQSLFVIASSDAVRPGAGFQSRGRMRLFYGLSIFLGGGFAVIPDGGDLDKLAHSWLYGTIDFGLTWPNSTWWLPDEAAVRHISSPFHHAVDGDSGLNFLMIRWSY